MRFYTEQHQFYCGIDLHAKGMYMTYLQHNSFPFKIIQSQYNSRNYHQTV